MTTDSQQILKFTITQRVLLTLLCFIMAFFGILGNGTVLYSSIRYNAIRLDRVSLLLVQNLAVADLLYTIFAIIPQLITTFAGRWVLGKIYCFISAQLTFIPATVNSLTVLLISIYRLWVVTHPFSGAKEIRVRIILVVTWILSSAGTIISLAYKSSSTFNPVNGKCSSGFYENYKAMVIFKVALTLLALIPLFMIIIVNTVLFFIAVKSSRKLQYNSPANYKALVMVCALSGLFITSWVPYVVYTLMKSRKLDIPRTLDIMAPYCFFLNSFGNPILYTVTNKRFGNYVRALLHQVFCGPCGQKTLPKGQLTVKQTSSSNVKSATEPTIKERSGQVTSTEGEQAF
jgi:hypothetical protein